MEVEAGDLVAIFIGGSEREVKTTLEPLEEATSRVRKDLQNSQRNDGSISKKVRRIAEDA